MAEPLGLVSWRSLTSGLARLDGIRFEVVGQPTEIAVAEERILGQMAAFAFYSESSAAAAEMESERRKWG